VSKIVVYVRAEDERRLEARGNDPAEWVRDLVRKGIEEMNGEVLSERGIGRPDDASRDSTVLRSESTNSRSEAAVGEFTVSGSGQSVPPSEPERAVPETPASRKTKRSRACRHHLPATRHCPYGCDD
jgi:hypothetical protein